MAADRADVIAALRAGRTQLDVAAEFGLPRSTVWRWAQTLKNADGPEPKSGAVAAPATEIASANGERTPARRRSPATGRIPRGRCWVYPMVPAEPEDDIERAAFAKLPAKYASRPKIVEVRRTHELWVQVVVEVDAPKPKRVAEKGDQE